MVRDLYSGVRAGRELSLMGSIQALAPIVAPVIGGILQTAFGWRASFILLVLIAAIAGVLAARLLPETLKTRADGPFSVAAMGGLFRSVLVHRGFLAYLGVMATTFVGLYAWVSGASIVIQGVYGLSPLTFGFTYAFGAMGYMLGTSIAARIVMRLGLGSRDWHRHRNHGGGRSDHGRGGRARTHKRRVAHGRNDDLPRRNGPCHAANHGRCAHPFADRAGTASSLLGFSQQSSAAIAAAVIGAYLGRSAWPVAGTVAVMGCLSFAIWAGTRSVRAAEN